MATPLTWSNQHEITALQQRATVQSYLDCISWKTLCAALPVITALASFIFLPFPLNIILPVIILTQGYWAFPSVSSPSYSPGYSRWHFSPVYVQSGRRDAATIYREDGAHVGVGHAAHR